MTEIESSKKTDKKVKFSKDVVFIEHKYQLMQTPHNFRLNQHLLNRKLVIGNKLKQSMSKEHDDNRYKPYNLPKQNRALKDITNIQNCRQLNNLEK